MYNLQCHVKNNNYQLSLDSIPPSQKLGLLCLLLFFDILAFGGHYLISHVILTSNSLDREALNKKKQELKCTFTVQGDLIIFFLFSVRRYT